MIYRTCFGCLKASGPCNHRDHLRRELAGLGLTSIKFACPDRKEPYSPGDPVWVELITSEPDYESGYTADFPATVIRVVGSKAVARIDPDAKSEHGEYDFEPKNENGFVKRPLKFFKARDGERRIVCPVCSRLDGNHEYGWTCHMAAEREKQELDRAAEQASEVIF